MRSQERQGRRGRRILWVTVGVLLGLWIHTLVSAYERSESTRSRRSEKATTASSKDDEKALIEKLDQVLANQEKILERFDAVMEELRIIKIRASMQ